MNLVLWFIACILGGGIGGFCGAALAMSYWNDYQTRRARRASGKPPKIPRRL